MAHPPKLLDQVRQLMRFKHMSLSTENSYVYYIKDYILFHHKRYAISRERHGRARSRSLAERHPPGRRRTRQRLHPEASLLGPSNHLLTERSTRHSLT